MEYIKIDERNALLSLSAEEAAGYREVGGTEKKRIVRNILERYGFFETGGRVFVQMYEQKNGGCELFFTRLGDRRREMAALSEFGGAMLTEYRQYPYRDGNCAVYVFDKLERMMLCCKMLDRAGYKGRSESYADRERGEYYLVLERESAYPAETLGRECPAAVITYIREHCKQFFGEHSAALLGQLV